MSENEYSGDGSEHEEEEDYHSEHEEDTDEQGEEKESYYVWTNSIEIMAIKRPNM